MLTAIRKLNRRLVIALVAITGFLAIGPASAQTADADSANWTARSPVELETLVGPIALYPDDLVAIVLPASTFPLQIVQASRYLEALEENPELEPDASWDESVVALLNYPETLALLNDDLDWTYDLGEAVVYQQGDVLNAVQSFREQAQNAGNLATDERQVVAVEDDGAITISPSDPEVIYVPYYDPAQVIVHQHLPVYHYYPYGYPVYYYPYPIGYSFRTGLFWGVTSAFLVSWHDHYLHVRHHSHFGHPYYGYTYYDPWYLRSSLYVNVNYFGSHYRWQPSYHDGGRPRHYAGFSRLRDRNYYRSPQERRIRSGWMRDGAAGAGTLRDRRVRGDSGLRDGTTFGGNRARGDGSFQGGSGLRTPQRDSAPAPVDERRARRVRSGRNSAQDIQARTRGSRNRDVDSRIGDVREARAGRLAVRDRQATQSTRRDRSGRFSARTPQPRQQASGDNRGAETRANGRGDLDRVARGTQLSGRQQAFGGNRRAETRVSGRSDLGRVARGTQLSGRSQALGSQPQQRAAVGGNATPRVGAMRSPSAMRSGVRSEQPMSMPRNARAGGVRSAAPAVTNNRAGIGRASGAAPSGGRAAPQNSGGRASGGRARSVDRGRGRAR